ncbi:hypothetical protein PM082_022557 [Marasmius tenuissimus]|nr:hypothetical protein PM082_022557 [Marasmius tenuissimus]
MQSFEGPNPRNENECTVSQDDFSIPPSTPPSPFSDAGFQPVANRGGLNVLRLGYSEEQLRCRLAELRDPTTDFKSLVHRRHFRERTPIFEVTRMRRAVLLQTPPGHGKTTTVSMIRYFYDILHADEFDDNFRDTVFRRGGVQIPFNFSGTLNEQTKQVVDRYASKLGLGDEAARALLIDEESAVKTLNNIVMYQDVIAEHSQRLVVCIDNYDKPFWDVEYTPVSSSLIQKDTDFSSKLESFFGTLFIMNHGRFVPLVFFAGEPNIFPTFSNHRGHVYDIIYGTKFAIDEMVGFNQEDLQRVAEHLDNDFTP